MSWPRMALSDICANPDDIKCGPFGTQLNKSEFRKKGVPLWGIKHVNRKFLLETDEFVDEEVAERLRSYDLVPGDVVMTRKGTIGNCAIYPSEFMNGIMHSDLLRLRINQHRFDPVFFVHQLQHSPNVARQLNLISGGAVMPGVNVGLLKQLEVLVPPLDDQKRIAHLLGKVEGLIAQRKQHLQQLDALLKSVFLEMFGIDRIADNDWPKVALGSMTQIVSGVTKGKRYADQSMREVPYMRVANVQDGHLNLSEIKTIEVSEEEIERYQLQRGDLLLTEGGDPDKLGRGALWNDEIPGCIHQNHIFRVRTTDASINPQFLCTLIGSKYGKSYFLKAAKQTTGIASINSTQLKLFPLIIPPIDLQNQFAVIVEKVEGIKDLYQQSLADLEALYGALSQKAFARDLDLSRVSL